MSTPVKIDSPAPTPAPVPLVSRLSGLFAAVRESARIRIREAEAAIESAELVEEATDAGLHKLDQVLGGDVPPKA